MNFDLTDDQRMLQDSVGRLLATHYSFDDRRSYTASIDGWSRSVWQEFADAGLLMLPFHSDDGGLGLGAVETMIVGEAFGRALVNEPYSAFVMAGTAIAQYGSGEQRARWLPGMMDGSRIVAFADRATATATRNGERWSLAGTATIVLAGSQADMIVVPTPQGIFVIPVSAVERRSYRLHGGGGAADLVFRDVVLTDADRLARPLLADAPLEAGIAYVAAEASGAMAAVFDLTVGHLKTRAQFGQPIGANQVLRHRVAEMLVELEQARSAAVYAALLADEVDTVERAKGFAAVKAVISRAGCFVGEQSVQLHGGLGVSDDHPISHYFRRLAAIGLLFGDADSHVARLAALGGFTGLHRAAI